ncbi:hypothetical protein [Microbacterium marinilacus]|uniref:Sugar ABC transporter ATPase n=1 Tax=Microbacterium marinilacus TaxID=415209 RepID=A0ABP7BQR8_9MICO|nr:hypothetical protein [Microbacterium marinilacus]MBY0689865.1 hypothetical protein [Microbacterium marinilacus]
MADFPEQSTPDAEREVDLADDAELELPPPTLDPDEAIEADADPVVDDERDEARGAGALDE